MSASELPQGNEEDRKDVGYHEGDGRQRNDGKEGGARANVDDLQGGDDDSHQRKSIERDSKAGMNLGGKINQYCHLTPST